MVPADLQKASIYPLSEMARSCTLAKNGAEDVEMWVGRKQLLDPAHKVG